MSEFIHGEPQDYDAIAAQYAPFPGAQLIEVADLSNEENGPKVGIYRADNGMANGEDLMVMLPSDFPDKPVTVGVDINDFDPRRQQPQKQYFVPKPDLPVEKPESFTPKQKTEPAQVFDFDNDSLRVVRPAHQKPLPYFSFTELKQHLRALGRDLLDLPEDESSLEHVRGLPSEIGQILRQSKKALLEVSSGMAERVAEEVDPRKVAAGFVAASILATGGSSIIESSGSQKPALNQEQLTNDPNVARPQDIKIVYSVPRSAPRVLDLATALDMDPEEIADQIETQVGARLNTTDRLPIDARLRINARGTVYTPKQNETLSSLSSRFDVPPNVLIAANAKLADTPADQVITSVPSVSIPRPITIISLPQGSTVEEATKNAHVAELTDNNPALVTAVDPGFDGYSMVIPEGLDREALAEITASLPTEAPAPVSPEAATQQISPEAAKINEMQKTIDINAPVNDIAGYVPAVQSMDAKFAPHDSSRRADMPAGYVKMLLPNEAPDILPLRTVAERTALLEMYTSPHTETAARSMSVAFQHFIDTKYPQYAGAVLRLRDANSPNHRTHQYGQMLDLSSSMGMGVSQYSDGPVSDSQFSPNYNQEFDIDMLKFMAGLRFGDQRAVKTVVSSNLTVVNTVNAQVGYDFMSYDDDGEHNDHWHIIMNKAYNLPSFALRARYLSWGPNEDLWVGDRALPITPEQHDSQHAPLESWFAEQMRIVSEQQKAQAAAAAEAANTPEKQLFDTQIALLDNIASHEGVWDSINTGVAGDTPVNSDRYEQFLHGTALTEYTIQEVMELQTQGVRAVGRYQFMPDTLKAAVKSTGIDPNRKFDPTAQNELGIYLLMDKRKSLGGYLKGKDVPVSAAVNDLCKEISSMPCMDGSGHYDGDAAGNNAAGGKERVKELIPMLEAIRDANLKVINKQ